MTAAPTGPDRAAVYPPGSGPAELLARFAVPGSRVAVALAVVGSALDPMAARSLAAPVAVAAVLVGLPHGAADAGLLAAAPCRDRRLLGPAYLAVAAVVVLTALLARVPVVLALLVLAVAHFGTGEVETTPGPTGMPPWRRWAAATAGGGLVVAVPFAAHPGPVDAVLAALDPGLPAALPAAARWAAVALAGGCGLVVAVADHQRGSHTAAGELLLLAALGALAPPVLAFGVYFGLWHSPRHTARLAGLPADHEAVTPPRPTPTLDRPVAVLAGLGSVGVAGAGVAVLTALGTPPPAVLAYLVLGLLALTVPHTAVVAWLDRRQVTAPPSDPPRTRLFTGAPPQPQPSTRETA